MADEATATIEEEELADEVGDVSLTGETEDEEQVEEEEVAEDEGKTEEPAEDQYDDKYYKTAADGQRVLKSQAEIIAMQREAEAAYMRSQNELGTLRKALDGRTEQPVEQVDETPKTGQAYIYSLYQDDEIRQNAYPSVELKVEEYRETAREALENNGWEEDAITEELTRRSDRYWRRAWSAELPNAANRVQSERSRIQEQTPSLVRSLAEQVLETMPGIRSKGITPASVEQAIVGDVNAVKQFAGANRDQQANMLRMTAIYLNGMRDVSDEIPVTTDGEPARTTSVLRRNTATTTTQVDISRDPIYREALTFVRNTSGLDEDDPDQKKRLDRMAKSIYEQRKAGGSR